MEYQIPFYGTRFCSVPGRWKRGPSRSRSTTILRFTYACDPRMREICGDKVQQPLAHRSQVGQVNLVRHNAEVECSSPLRVREKHAVLHSNRAAAVARDICGIRRYVASPFGTISIPDAHPLEVCPERWRASEVFSRGPALNRRT
jgi:hypothetical protein